MNGGLPTKASKPPRPTNTSGNSSGQWNVGRLAEQFARLPPERSGVAIAENGPPVKYATSPPPNASAISRSAAVRSRFRQHAPPATAPFLLLDASMVSTCISAFCRRRAGLTHEARKESRNRRLVVRAAFD